VSSSPIIGAGGFQWPMDLEKLAEELSTKTDSLLYLFDHEDRLVAANENTEKFVGGKLAVNARLEDHLGGDVVREIRKLFQKARETSCVHEFERSFSHRGKPVWLFTYLTALDLPGAKGKWVFGISRDVTEKAWERVNLKEAKERLDFIAEHAGDIIALISPDGYTLWLNNAAERITGYSLADFARKPITELEMIHPEDRHPIEKSFREMLENPIEQTPEFRVKRKDGNWVHLEGRARPVLDKDGNFTTAVMVLRDITRLREVEQNYRFLAEHAHDLICIMDSEGRFTYVSPSSMKLLGYSPEHLSGRSITDICHPDEIPDIKDNLKTLVAGKSEACRLQHRLRDSNGRFKHFESILKAFTNPKTSAPYIQCASRDITDRKQMEEALIASHKMTALGTLAGGIAHEFNNLHSIILSHASFLMNEHELSGEALEDTKVIIDACNRATKITKELTAYARTDIKNRKDIDLNTTVKNVLNIVSGQFRSEGIEIEQNIVEHEIIIKADKTLLQQVIMHLLTNAGHAVSISDRKRIVVETRAQNGWAYIKVTDSGVGIEEDDLLRVFDPFYTTKGPLGGSTIPGTGLGLSVCNSIVREHGGSIRAESDPGKGSTFTVWLPLEKEQGIEAPTTASKPTGKAGRILVVDDEPNICGMIKRILKSMGHEVEATTRGKEALEKLKEKEYDVVLLDLQMPDMPGENILSSIREKPVGGSPAFIIISGKIDMDREALLGQGAFDVLEKPFHMQVLAEKVEQALGNKKQAGE